MDDKRIQKLNNQIRDTIGEIIIKELDIPVGALITVTRVEVAPKSMDSSVFISVLPDDKAEDVFSELSKRKPYFQALLQKKIRMNPRPKIHFKLDRTEKEAAEIEKVLESL